MANKAPDTVNIGFAKGIDNRSDETKIPSGYVREAFNVDLTSNGVMQRRQGSTKVASTTNGHSLWSSPESPFALFMDGGTLYALWSDYSTTVVRTGLQARDTFYQFINGKVYYSNGADTGCVYIDGTSGAWGVERPAASFYAMATSTGGMHAGTYQVALTFMDTFREESGAAESIFVDVQEGGGIQLTNIPAPLATNVIACRVYLSQANGETLFWNADLPNGMQTAQLRYSDRGKPLATQFLAPMPPCKYLLKYNGRMLGASGKYLFFSESLRYGQYHETKGYIRFGSDITCVTAPDAEGTQLYIGTLDKTYRYAGSGMDNGALSIVDHNGIVPGSAVIIPGSLLGIPNLTKPVPMWLATNGLFWLGAESGLIPIKQDHVASDIPTKAAAIYAERDGIQQMILSYYGGRKTRLSMGDAAIATVYDKSGN